MDEINEVIFEYLSKLEGDGLWFSNGNVFDLVKKIILKIRFESKNYEIFFMMIFNEKLKFYFNQTHLQKFLHIHKKNPVWCGSH